MLLMFLIWSFCNYIQSKYHTQQFWLHVHHLKVLPVHISTKNKMFPVELQDIKQPKQAEMSDWFCARPAADEANYSWNTNNTTGNKHTVINNHIKLHSSQGDFPLK